MIKPHQEAAQTAAARPTSGRGGAVVLRILGARLRLRQMGSKSNVVITNGQPRAAARNAREPV
jgi:hypothetical protein